MQGRATGKMALQSHFSVGQRRDIKDLMLATILLWLTKPMLL
jgi:hypothetical protein